MIKSYLTSHSFCYRQSTLLTRLTKRTPKKILRQEKATESQSDFHGNPLNPLSILRVDLRFYNCYIVTFLVRNSTLKQNFITMI